jgi:Tfp pilus assembly protein PilZ
MRIMNSDKNLTDDSKLVEMLSQKIKKFSDDQKHDVANFIKSIEKKGGKRNTDRRYFKVSVDYSVKDKFYSDTLENISAGGAFIRTTRPIQVGDSTTMVASIPGIEGNTKMKGKIIRRSEEGVGVEFFEEHKEILSDCFNQIFKC